MILEFERPIRELEERIAELHRLAGPSAGLQAEISRLEGALDAAKRRIYANLSPYQRVQVARHPDRPNFRAYRDVLSNDFYELSGDRFFGDDPAVRGGLARLKRGGHNVVLLGHDKGGDTRSRVKGNFGMAHPEGYRKALRCAGGRSGPRRGGAGAGVGHLRRPHGARESPGASHLDNHRRRRLGRRTRDVRRGLRGDA